MFMLCVVGSYVGAKFSSFVQEISMVTYGYIAFAVLPITICLFGLKELNSAYVIVADKISLRERETLEIQLESKFRYTVGLGFTIVLLQVVMAFSLNFIQNEPPWYFGVWGGLIGATLAVLVYGLFICSSVKEIYSYINAATNKAIFRQQQKDLLSALQDKKE